MKLLLIDAADNSAFAGSKLRDLGYTIDRVVDGKQALERAARSDYDVIVLDLTLPRDESLSILHEIREAHRETVILVLSSREQIHDRVTALIQGADDFLVKPVAAAELHARIQRLSTAGAGSLPAADFGRQRAAHGGQPDFRIDELLRYCERGKIELVISEVPLTALLQRIYAALEATARARGIALLLPQDPLPTVLVDAGWLQQLLSNLLFNALLHGKPGARIDLRVSSNGDDCRIDIETRCGFGRDLSAAMRFARQLNLRLDTSGTQGEAVRVGIDGIKIR